jgi:bifunctional isochorismate lyase / aryl carrier protein
MTTLETDAPRSPALSELRLALADLLDSPETLGLDDSLLDSGLDSVRLMMLVDRLQQGGADVGFADLAERPTLRAWVELLEARR